MTSRLFVAAFASLALFACQGEKSKAAPAPSSSVVSIGVGMQGCDDVPLCQKRCDDGNGDTCRRLGVTFQLGQGAPKDLPRATASFVKACALKSAMGCVSAGQMYEYAHGVDKDVARAADFYRIACELSYAPGCHNFAIMVENGRGVPQDDLLAARYYDMACAAGATVACTRAAELRERALHAPIFVDAGFLDAR